MRVNDDAFGHINVDEKHLETDRAAQELDWAGLPDDEAFAELRALPERDKRTLFASCVARTLKGQLAFEPKARPEVEATVARLGIDFTAAVRATAIRSGPPICCGRACARTASSPSPAKRWARPGRKRKPSRRRRRSPGRCRKLSPTATACPPGSRPRAAPRPSPGRRPASAPSIRVPSMTAPRLMTRGQPPPNRNRRRSITPSVDALEHSSVDPSGADSEAPQDDATEADALDPKPAPVGAQQPMNARVHSVVESIDAPAVAERRAAALASNVNADATPSVEREQVLDPPARQRPRQRCGVAGDTGIPAPRLNHRVLPSRQRLAGTGQRGVFHSLIDHQEIPHVYRTEFRYGRARQ